MKRQSFSRQENRKISCSQWENFVNEKHAKLCRWWHHFLKINLNIWDRDDFIARNKDLVGTGLYWSTQMLGLNCLSKIYWTTCTSRLQSIRCLSCFYSIWIFICWVVKSALAVDKSEVRLFFVNRSLLNRRTSDWNSLVRCWIYLWSIIIIVEITVEMSTHLNTWQFYHFFISPGFWVLINARFYELSCITFVLII